MSLNITNKQIHSFFLRKRKQRIEEELQEALAKLEVYNQISISNIK